MPRKLKPPYDPQEEARQTIERIIRSEEREREIESSPLNQSIVRLDNWLYRHHFDAVFDYAGMSASFMAGVALVGENHVTNRVDDTIYALAASGICSLISSSILQKQYDRNGIKARTVEEHKTDQFNRNFLLFLYGGVATPALEGNINPTDYLGLALIGIFSLGTTFVGEYSRRLIRKRVDKEVEIHGLTEHIKESKLKELPSADSQDDYQELFDRRGLAPLILDDKPYQEAEIPFAVNREIVSLLFDGVYRFGRDWSRFLPRIGVGEKYTRSELNYILKSEDSPQVADGILKERFYVSERDYYFFENVGHNPKRGEDVYRFSFVKGK